LLRLHASAAICGSFLFSATPCLAQQPVPQTQPAIRSTAELVKLDVTVLDQHGDYVSDLAQKDFRVLDDESDRDIIYFAPVDAPARVLVIVETSPAVYLIQDQHLAAAYALLQGLRPDDEVALIAYDRAPRSTLGFTAEKSALVQALGQLQYTLGSGELNFYDSLSAAIDWLGPVLGKKSIVVLTTGLDSSPPERWDALVNKLRSNEVVIYSVALGGSLRRPATKGSRQAKKTKDSATNTESTDQDAVENPLSFQKADAALKSLAAITGGQSFFPDSSQDFARIYREIASSLRHQYVLGIAPAHDGRLHALTVELPRRSIESASSTPATVKQSARGAFRVFARQGYLAPAP
jgi:VWFA-related protein